MPLTLTMCAALTTFAGDQLHLAVPACAVLCCARPSHATCRSAKWHTLAHFALPSLAALCALLMPCALLSPCTECAMACHCVLCHVSCCLLLTVFTPPEFVPGHVESLPAGAVPSGHLRGAELLCCILPAACCCNACLPCDHTQPVNLL